MEANILIVEDDQEIARIMRDTLLNCGHYVTWATTGLEGLQDFRSNDYDLVLIDLMMPEMDGFTLCKNIRWESEVPIIIVSARKDDVDKVAGLGLGADDYISKPFSLTELEARVKSHLRRWFRYQGIEQKSEIISFDGGLTIDYTFKKVYLHQEEIPLTTKEYDLLQLLSRNMKRVFTKREIYEHIWQQADINDVHTVTVHVKSIREKIMDTAKNPKFIQTVWGKGYMFIGEEQ
nr:response regulator transcription factor [Lysinibacillus timonensis]